MDYVAKVFDLLEIKPQERFKLFDIKRNEVEEHLYFLTNKLDLWYKNKMGYYYRSGVYSITNILNGTVQITKIPQNSFKLLKQNNSISEEEETAIKYFLLAGYKYMAQDKEGRIYAYKIKPIKSGIFWVCPDERLSFCKVEIPISFLSWEDSEPFYIGE